MSVLHFHVAVFTLATDASPITLLINVFTVSLVSPVPACDYQRLPCTCLHHYDTAFCIAVLHPPAFNAVSAQYDASCQSGGSLPLLLFFFFFPWTFVRVVRVLASFVICSTDNMPESSSYAALLFVCFWCFPSPASLSVMKG